MQPNIQKPIAFFDIEATGINIVTDRIIELAVLKIMPDGSEEEKVWQINPGMPIPEDSIKIHGITDKDVEGKPYFKDVAKEIDEYFKGCDLGGYNLIMFDIPILSEELLRCEIEFDVEKRHIIDAQKIFYLMEPRTLAGAYKFYCKKDLVNAHSATADTRATYEVFKSQLEHYQGTKIKTKEDEEIEPIVNDIPKLHALTVSKFADLAGRIAYNDKGEEVFNFGKFKNKPVSEVLKQEPNYYNWMMRGDFPLQTKRVLTKIKLRNFNKS